MRNRLSGEIEGNSDEFSLFLGLEVYRGAALTEVFGVGGEDIFWVATQVHSSLLRDSRLSVPD